MTIAKHVGGCGVLSIVEEGSHRAKNDLSSLEVNKSDNQ